MAPLPRISFVAASAPAAGTAVVFADEAGAFGPVGAELDRAAGGGLTRAVRAAAFKGKKFSALEVVAPGSLALDRVVIVGLGAAADLAAGDWFRLGGAAAGKLSGAHAAEVTVVVERPGGAVSGADAADAALGFLLRDYRFDRYKSKSGEDDEQGTKTAVFATEDLAGADAAWSATAPIANGVVLARDLVNEPANVLGTVEFAERASALADLGVRVEVLGEPEMRAERMNALLGVSQGSVRPPRLVVLEWRGGAEGEAPLLFVGKGVVFDSGGISIKPAQGMEDMKGDMGGAAAVTGLLSALAGRKAKVNAIGVIGLVENMPDGNAQRPGDIVTARSGTTIEVINTDAEGRLVLADALHYAIERFKPKLVIDLATLTGAIMVALGHHHAGLFSNDDTLSANLTEAGLATGEAVWRMPLGRDYDKMIESKFADIKNTGGRYGGSITAAQFLKRFVGDTPWAHLDIAGTAMGSPATETNRSWGSGWGVRLLERFVATFHEAE